jgi:Tfp pilus assembly protein PilO
MTLPAKNRRSSWMLTMLPAAVAVAYVVFAFLPGRRAIADLRDQVAQKQNYVGQFEDVAKALAAAERELERTQTYTKAWKQRAPTDEDRSALYGRINALAKQADTVTTRFDPKPVNPHSHVRELPLTMACSGTFAQVHEFLRSLESLPVAIWVESLVIKRTGETGGCVTCETSLLVFTDNPENSD